MKLEMLSPSKNPKSLIGLFITGSLIVLLLCLCGTALTFSMTFLKKEKERAAISLDQLSHSFDFQYRLITEEVWTQNYEAISIRLGGIAKQLGHATYDVVLADPQGKCIYVSSSTNKNPKCELPVAFQSQISIFKPTSDPQPNLRFDLTTNQYIYMVPLYVGAILKGYLYAALSDPYEFYRGNSIIFAGKMFLLPVIAILLIWFFWLIASKRFILKPYLSALVDLEKTQAVAQLAAQVAHDIRAPLVTAKSVIRSLQGVNQKQLRLLNTAHSRMENIANELIDVYITSNRIEAPRFSFVSAAVDSIVAEKTAMLGENSDIEIRTDVHENAHTAGVPISSSDFSRVLSNLLNNAIEAVRSQSKASISVAVTKGDDVVRIAIKDNGKGMTEEVLHQICTVGGTFGKARGAGMGLQHAKSTIGEAHGTLKIQSSLGKGTTVTLEIPVASAPAWFAQAIAIDDDETVVVLDDDESVHLSWKQKLADRKLVHLRDPEEFDINQYPRQKCRYIFDYEISGSAVSGLDLIVSYGLGSRAVLVTSYFNEPKIQKAIERAGSSILPKFMMCDVEIRKPAPKSVSVSEASEAVDLVLIDDDPLVHEMWAFEAKQQDKLVLAVSRLVELEGKSIDLETPIYVDKNLKDGQCGLKVAQTLHDRGFKTIYLATGEHVEPEKTPPFLRGVLGKDFPLHA